MNPESAIKRQAAIIGPTPEFVRWSIRQSCALRSDTDVDSVDQTEKRLRAIRAAGAAIDTGMVRDGFALRRDECGEWWGFRLSAVADVWGGIDFISRLCAACPANVASERELHGQLAGCCGWLATEGRTEQWHQAVDDCWRDCTDNEFFRTRPRWYGLWSSGPLEGARSVYARHLFATVASSSSPVAEAARRFHHVLTSAANAGLTIDVELVPAGNSDGIVWTIGAHCERCRAPREEVNRSSRCHACGIRGARHEVIRRRVLGKRPWVPLARLAGPQERSRLIRLANDGRNDNNLDQSGSVPADSRLRGE